MRNVALLLFVLVVALAAQTVSNGQITIKPAGAASGCVADPAGDVLCAGTDGFYISIAGGSFQKVATGTVAPPSYTSITCTSAMLSSGSTGNFTASGCTLK